MSETSEIASHWKLHKAQRRSKKQHNMIYSTGLLRDKGIDFTVHNHGIHLRIGKYIDFWPGTGKWIDHEACITERGVLKLIDHVQRKPVP